MSEKGNKIISNVIMYILKHNVISVREMISRFNCSIETGDNIIRTMHAAGLIGDIDENGMCPVLVRYFDDINEGIIKFLNDYGFTKDDINEAFKTLPTEEKEEVSFILNEKRDWFDTTSKMPDLNIPVIVRLVNRNMIYSENRCEVLYAEDVKIAEWDGEKWSICKPYPKYDYSPITKFSELNEDTVVSHWAEADADDLNGWKNRFSRFNNYKLKIEVDPEYEEDVYRALMWGASYIAKFGGPDFNDCPSGEGLRRIYETLCDMQAVIDSNKDNRTNEEDI